MEGQLERMVSSNPTVEASTPARSSTFCGFTVGSMSPAITPVTGAKLAINHLPSQGKSMISIAGVVVVVVVVLAVVVIVFFPLLCCFLFVVAAVVVVVALAGVVAVAFAVTVCC